ncbi:hypothetical protein GQ53DRAFT_443551 [Thozetella sp. PMI_491]|nr:hypothetical protein GQ53DRAFT_443551 [Thozetella sp. PMI_491]
MPLPPPSLSPLLSSPACVAHVADAGTLCKQRSRQRIQAGKWASGRSWHAKGHPLCRYGRAGLRCGWLPGQESTGDDGDVPSRVRLRPKVQKPRPVPR